MYFHVSDEKPVNRQILILFIKKKFYEKIVNLNSDETD